MEQSGHVGRHAPHRWLVRSIVAVATLIGIIAIFAVWANRQLLSTSGWTATSTKLIQSPPVREAVSGYATEQIYANVDVTGELRSSLPSQLKPLAGPAAGALRNVVQKGVTFALERPLVQELWRSANEVTHAQFVKLIENKGKVVKLPGGGTVVLDLRPVVAEAAARVGVPSSVVAKIPPKAAEVQVVKSKNLETMQTAINLLRQLAIVLPLLTFALYALAVFLARGRRPHTVVNVGASLIFAGVVVLIARSLIGKTVVDSLASTESVRPAAESVWAIATSMLVSVAGAVIFVGVPIVLAGLLGGPSRTAVRLRHSMAPYLRDRPEIAFGAVTLLLIVLFAWGPIPATRNWLGILLIIALSFFGAQMLRRQTAVEFPEAQASGGLALRHGWEAATGLFSRGGAGLRSETHAARQRLHPNGPSPSGAAQTEEAVGAVEGVAAPAAATAAPGPGPQTPLATHDGGLAAQLQQLASLRSSGALTEEEYAAAKRQLIGAAATG